MLGQKGAERGRQRDQAADPPEIRSIGPPINGHPALAIAITGPGPGGRTR